MKRLLIMGVMAVLLSISLPGFAKVIGYRAGAPDISNVTWSLEEHWFKPTQHYYVFTGQCKRNYDYLDDSNRCLYLKNGNWKNAEWSCRLRATCYYYPGSGKFYESLLITVEKAKWVCEGVSFKYANPLAVPWKNRVSWHYITTGTFSADPWLYCFKLAQLQNLQVIEYHSSLDMLPEELRILYSITHPMTIFAIDSTKKTQLKSKAMTAPEEYCDNYLKLNLAEVLGLIQIVSPAPGQTFENGRVTFEFKLPCQFSFGLGKHAFVISLQRCKSGCVKKGGALIKRSGTGNSKKFIEEFWEPVAIPFMENNTMQIWFNTAPQIFESEASRIVEIPYEGEGQKFRFKVEARLWDGNKFITVPGPKEWHYFWVGRNLQRPDLVVSKIELRLSGSNKLEFNICVKDTGNAPVKSVGGKKVFYDTEMEVVGFKNGQPYPKLSTAALYSDEFPMTIHVPPGGEGCGWIDVPRPAFETAFGLKVTVDPKNRIPEIEESNNTLSAQLLFKGDKSQGLLKPKIQVTLAATGFEWKIGKGYKVTWKGRFVKPNRYVRVFLVGRPDVSPGSEIGPEIKVELSPPSGFPFDEGKHGVTVPLDTPRGSYRIYLEMVDVPIWKATSDAVIHVVGKALKPGALSKGPLINLHRPDLVVSGFKGEILQPGQADHSGHATNDRRVQLRWTVKNIGDAPCDATVLRVRGIADGNAPLPSPTWEPDVNQKRRDFPVLLTDLGQAYVYEVFAVPDGSVKFRFNAQVNPDHAVTEFNYPNNSRLSTFAPHLVGVPSVHFLVSAQEMSLSTGLSFNIKWTGHAGLKTGRIRLVLKQANRRVMNITSPSGVVNKGYYRWKIPAHVKPGKYAVVMENMKGKTLATLPITITALKRKPKATGAPSVITSIKVNRPSKGTVWKAGEKHTITWKSENIRQKVRVYLKKGGKLTLLTHLMGISDGGTFGWTIHGNMLQGCDYTIVVKTIDGKVEGISDKFCIEARGTKIRKDKLNEVPKVNLKKRLKKPPRVHINLGK